MHATVTIDANAASSRVTAATIVSNPARTYRVALSRNARREGKWSVALMFDSRGLNADQ